MEKVDAAINGWQQAPFDKKVEADANYKRCLDWLLTPEHMTGMRLGLASHNLFDVAWTHLLASERGVADRVQFEMLQGMAPAQAKTVSQIVDPTSPMLLYTPAVRSEDFDVAISYLFRRLEENASNDNFLRHLFDLASNPATFNEQAAIFRRSLEIRDELELGPRRQQNRLKPQQAAYKIGEPFRNEPETDPTQVDNRRWIAEVTQRAAQQATQQTVQPVKAPLTESVTQVDYYLADANAALSAWRKTSLVERQETLHRVGDQLAERRGELIATMMAEANKTFVEADGEVAEAIDFARYYADRALELGAMGDATFEPLGVVTVIPPWNFPVAIPAGGVLASLAAGNTVLFKPAPETPRCAEIVAEACWEAGIARTVLQFVRTPDNEVGQALVVGADAVILTGSTETAELFRSWKPDLKLFAETSGKNAMIITPNADIDLAVADLVSSAFGHSGQKCSAASLAIVVGDAYHSHRFRRQLIDAVESIELGSATRIETTMGPLIGPANDRLQRGLTTLDSAEQWLVEPRLVTETDGVENLWSPGVRVDVDLGSWFHKTECFGPVLGLIHAKDLDEAIAIQNSSDFGLTGGIQSLDPSEVQTWLDRVEVGNAYVNRQITGAIVQRQPFGGWKKSSIGAGAKAGGPNYVSQLGTWSQDPNNSVRESAVGPLSGPVDEDDYQQAWDEHFAAEHDPTGLFCEQNIFRYRPLTAVALRYGAEADPAALRLTRRAAAVCGVKIFESNADDESEAALAARLDSLGVTRLRVVGLAVGAELQQEANRLGVYVDRAPVTAVGRLELQHYLREQAISRTLHRFGNLVGANPAGS
ncbi:MAG: proline dehydrogenase family protein, partial [Acidimicrobiales bacterium]